MNKIYALHDDNLYVFKVERYKSHWRVVEYREFFKGLFLSPTGIIYECDSYNECVKTVLALGEGE